MFGNRYDVIVVGGGPAGIAAAVSSERTGARTLLIERFGIVGGMLTGGYVNPVLGLTSPGTMRDEVLSLLDATCSKTRNGNEMSVNTEEATRKLLEFLVSNGVDVMLQTPVVDTIKEENVVKGVVVGTQNGLKTIEADVVIDATGDGFVAAVSGAEYWIGRESDGKCQPVTLEFTISGVDEDKAITCWGGSDPVTLESGEKYADFCKRMNKEGVLPKNVDIVRLHRTNKKGERSINATQANGYDTLTPEGVLSAELELRPQIDCVMDFLRKYIPGYEKCFVKATPSTLGVRETRRIVGDYTVNDQDVEEGRRKDDVVVHKAWFLIDIHNPSGTGQAEGHSQPAVPYDIPYRSLLPNGLEGIITAGRCISGTHRAHASYRVMGVCLATGEAAGTAAALASKMKVSPRQVSYEKIQKTLEEKGIILFD